MRAQACRVRSVDLPQRRMLHRVGRSAVVAPRRVRPFFYAWRRKAAKRATANFLKTMLAAECVSLFLEKSLRGNGRCPGGDRGARRTVELDHDIGRMSRGFHRIENAYEIDLALTERTVSGKVLTTAEVLQVHVDSERRKVFDHLRRIGKRTSPVEGQRTGRSKRTA